jgi:hypothetical protein
MKAMLVVLNLIIFFFFTPKLRAEKLSPGGASC